MKIGSSAVTMESDRFYSSYSEKQTAELTTNSNQEVTLEISEESKTLMEQLNENKTRLEDEEKERKHLANKQWAEMLLEQNKKSQQVKKEEENQVKSKEEMKLEVLRRMLEALKRMKGGKFTSYQSEMKKLQAEYKSSLRLQSGAGAVDKPSGNSQANGASSSGLTRWTKTTVTSSFFSEVENTAYQANGFVKTADGREINFNVSVEMSRAFCAKYESFIQEDYLVTDPLVINLDGNVGNISDQKFLFDLDADGKEEYVSFTGQGSGFLALDKNKDGKINDGNELFGTQSGNGFKDLAKYDKDGNGWIDEADSVFDDLKIWTKDEAGKDRLISLKEAGVGAIYLDYAQTQFSLNNADTNETNGIVRSTGIYLKESGEVGTIQHIDLVV